MQVIHGDAVRGWEKVGHGRSPKAISTVCPHCGEKAIFTLSSHQDDSVRLTIASTGRCPGCNKQVHFWAIRLEYQPKGNGENPSVIYMYPMAEGHYQHKKFMPEVPGPLQAAFDTTVEAFNSKNYTATAVCARRTLEGIFKYLVDEGNQNAPLAKLIEQVKLNKDLAAPLTSLSAAIKDGGNLGAHFDMEKEVTSTSARHMVELVEYLITYLYVLPEEIKKLELSIGKGT